MNRMKYIFGFFLVIAIAVLAVNYNRSRNQAVTTDETAVYRRISAQEAKDMMDKNEEVVIVDVRTQGEYDSGHIEGAILIPNETIVNDRPEQLSDTDAIILVYCRSGNRSNTAAKKLINAGYRNVYDFGGIIDWPFEIVSD